MRRNKDGTITYAAKDRVKVCVDDEHKAATIIYPPDGFDCVVRIDGEKETRRIHLAGIVKQWDRGGIGAIEYGEPF